ncbi:MAG TPA: thioesterase family protein [Ruminiclostridium sp.]
MEIKIGMSGNAEIIVDANNTAKAMGSGDLEVFATPAMIALMEKAATLAISECIPEGTSTVGTMINVKHITATPVGMKVAAQATLIEVDGKRLLFTVEAFDGKDKIGEGQHERFIINVDKFLARTNGKK